MGCAIARQQSQQRISVTHKVPAARIWDYRVAATHSCGLYHCCSGPKTCSVRWHPHKHAEMDAVPAGVAQHGLGAAAPTLQREHPCQRAGPAASYAEGRATPAQVGLAGAQGALHKLLSSSLGLVNDKHLQALGTAVTTSSPLGAVQCRGMDLRCVGSPRVLSRSSLAVLWRGSGEAWQPSAWQLYVVRCTYGPPGCAGSLSGAPSCSLGLCEGRPRRGSGRSSHESIPSSLQYLVLWLQI